MTGIELLVFFGLTVTGRRPLVGNKARNTTLVVEIGHHFSSHQNDGQMGLKVRNHKSIRTHALYTPLTKGPVEGSTRVIWLAKNDDPHSRSIKMQSSPGYKGRLTRIGCAGPVV
jgi:hypothetical protein